MKTFSRLFSAALIIAAASVASASTITIESYGSLLNNGAANTFVGSNSAVTYVGSNIAGTATFAKSNATYNLPANSPWTTLSNPASNWVSFDPNNYPNGSNSAPNGTYYFQSTFSAASNSTGSITVLADDTTSVFLNLTQITPSAVATPAGSCTTTSPNCITPTTYNLIGFVNGINTLSFGVKQDFGYATGLDFTGTVATTPEPSSLAFLATGLLSAAGAIRRRIKA